MEMIFEAIEKWQVEDPGKKIRDIKYHFYLESDYNNGDFTEGITLIVE